MITHQRLVEEVASRARLPGTDDAARVVRATLAALSHRLETPQQQRLRQAVPGPERDAVPATVPPSGDGAVEFQEEVGRNLATSPERARYLAQTVLSRIAAADPELGRELRGALPADTAALFAAPESRPERANTATNLPAPLTPEELETELRRRPQWAGDVHRLTRTVALPSDRTPPLLNQVAKDARDLNHHPGYEQTGDSITFTLLTRSINAVTRRDLELADRIDAAVAAVGSGGHPG